MSVNKNLVRAFLQFCLRSDRLWNIVRRFPLRGTVAARKKVIARRLVARLANDPTVGAGPFAGLVYPHLQSAGSALVPKLLGTYESELHETIRSLRSVNFSTIIDVGCAEGYYAVGLARLFPATPVRAYDISEVARHLCSAMAGANHATQLAIHGRCDRRDLLALSPAGANLIISDCEGYEKDLFDAEVARHLARSYFIIELHDFKDRTISHALSPRFAVTHEVELIASIPDSEKVLRYTSARLGLHDEFEKDVAFAENRPDGMQWLVAKPRLAADRSGRQREPPPGA